MELFVCALLLLFIGASGQDPPAAATAPGVDKIAELFSQIETDELHKDQSDIINNDYNSVLCWQETINSVEYKNGTRNADRQFSIILETPGDLNDQSLKDEFSGTKRSKTVNYTSLFETPTFLIQINKTLTCGVGKVIIKEFTMLPNGKKRIQLDLGSRKMLSNYEFKKCANLTRCKTKKLLNPVNENDDNIVGIKVENPIKHTNANIITFKNASIHSGDYNGIISNSGLNRIPSNNYRIPSDNYRIPPQNDKSSQNGVPNGKYQVHRNPSLNSTGNPMEKIIHSTGNPTEESFGKTIHSTGNSTIINSFKHGPIFHLIDHQKIPMKNKEVPSKPFLKSQPITTMKQIPPANYYLIPTQKYRPIISNANRSESTPKENTISKDLERILLEKPCDFRHKLNITFQISVHHIITQSNNSETVKSTTLLNALKFQTFNITQRNLKKINKPNEEDANKAWDRLIRLLSRQYFIDCCNKIIPFSDMPTTRTGAGIRGEKASILFDEESRAAMAAVHKQMQTCGGGFV